jgi:CDGSH-type Zn-finger protein
MEKSKAAGNSPQMVQLESGKTYAWCACGRSSNQPWCDGSHQVTSITPTVFVADKTEARALCMCKQTKTPPFCDGTHLSVGD